MGAVALGLWLVIASFLTGAGLATKHKISVKFVKPDLKTLDIDNARGK